jgi:hypothetical protein
MMLPGMTKRLEELYAERGQLMELLARRLAFFDLLDPAEPSPESFPHYLVAAEVIFSRWMIATMSKGCLPPLSSKVRHILVRLAIVEEAILELDGVHNTRISLH